MKDPAKIPEHAQSAPFRGVAALHAALGYAPPSYREAAPITRENAPLVGEEPPLDAAQLAILQQRLEDDPEATLAAFRRTWHAKLTLAQLREGLRRAGVFLRSPEAGAVALRAASALESAASVLPDTFHFDGMDREAIPIDYESTKFEKVADALGWIFLSSPFILASPFRSKAPFASHARFDSRFVYDRPEPPAGGQEVALVSDFGTGLYHSRYIAKRLRTRPAPYCDIFHLGDVYYSGRESEFATRFRAELDPLVPRTPIWTLNSNHEMLSMGRPYFRYLDDRRALAPKVQQQEGSYFCVRYGQSFQVVGIDTAYFGNGRCRDDDSVAWLANVLRDGRQAGLTNILLSADEPYAYDEDGTTDLLADLRDIVLGERNVDLWFWGNTHYCALFDRTTDLPFVGSCIGHGGCPYERLEPGKRSPAPARFLETGARFPAWTRIRQDVGNHGYVEMVIHGGKPEDRAVTLRYIDWMGQHRCRARLAATSGGFLAFDGPVEDATLGALAPR